jgi:hypothetical protein
MPGDFMRTSVDFKKKTQRLSDTNPQERRMTSFLGQTENVFKGTEKPIVAQKHV